MKSYGDKEMEFFVTGVNGKLGSDIMNKLHRWGHQGIGLDLSDE